LRDRFRPSINALKDMFQVCNLFREADKIVHQIWWQTGDAVRISHCLLIAKGRHMTSPKYGVILLS
jgi:hypothetical protein